MSCETQYLSRAELVSIVGLVMQYFRQHFFLLFVMHITVLSFFCFCNVDAADSYSMFCISTHCLWYPAMCIAIAKVETNMCVCKWVARIWRTSNKPMPSIWFNVNYLETYICSLFEWMFISLLKFLSDRCIFCLVRLKNRHTGADELSIGGRLAVNCIIA